MQLYNARSDIAIGIFKVHQLILQGILVYALWDHMLVYGLSLHIGHLQKFHKQEFKSVVAIGTKKDWYESFTKLYYYDLNFWDEALWSRAYLMKVVPETRA